MELMTYPLLAVLVLSRAVLGDDGASGTMPGSHDELRFDVPPGTGQCFFVPLLATQNIHVAFEVIRGADRNIDMVLQAPTGQMIDQRLWVSDGQVQAKAITTGDYRVCVDNSFSRFTSKLIYLYIITWQEDEWDRHSKELANFAVSIENVTNSLRTIDMSIQTARKHIVLARSRAMGDQYSLLDNSTHVQNMSIIMCLVIMASSGFQVFFVKRLFNVPNVTPNSKPRA
ncbi:hypothetical protein CAPTEDRAFT_160152 [Capitella teleta]|uniref:GOLD domain-containing protein n=1 Tax=Capitella teleta TaxID=283909 RepID=R7UUK0_CAPTE|nr:hypothetical protein CAPTEDRAFT_160152 [Capitella teleta]|eukprot:ELU09870.1 hypothetical protein CAPTEDRAFT_160152 [Capitella teleta]